MKVKKIRFYRQILGSGFIALLVLALLVPSYSLAGSSGFNITAIGIEGLSNSNNVQFVFGRYVLTAQYSPSIRVDDNSTLEQLDNNVLYVIDTKKPKAKPDHANLGNFYYPTKILYNEKKGIVFVRATQIVESKEYPGEYEASAAIVKLPVHLDEDGKPLFGQPLAFQIKSRGDSQVGDAPDDFLVSQDGQT